MIHEGGATPAIALWLWLGTAQLVELTTADDPVALESAPEPA